MYLIQWELFSAYNMHHTSTESLSLSRTFYLGLLNGPLIGSLSVWASYSCEEALLISTLNFQGLFFLLTEWVPWSWVGHWTSQWSRVCLFTSVLFRRWSCGGWLSPPKVPLQCLCSELCEVSSSWSSSFVTTKWGHNGSADMLMDSSLLCHPHHLRLTHLVMVPAVSS